MSRAINLWKFTGFFVLYVITSVILHFGIANTIPAWLFYLFLLLPFYLLCLVYLVGISIEHWKQRQTTIRYRKFLLYPVVIFQILTILFSPTNCYGWKQGKACYSFIQSLLVNVQTNPLHWKIIDLMFPVALLVYVISLGILLGMMRIENQQS